MAEIAAIPLTAELVALEACDTARGETRQTDERLDLTRAFLIAGAASVLATRWKVPDEPATIRSSDHPKQVPATSWGETAVAAEANRRFAGRLRKPVGPRTASDVLRRLLAEGRIELAREGKAFHEALYRRRPQRRGR